MLLMVSYSAMLPVVLQRVGVKRRGQCSPSIRRGKIARWTQGWKHQSGWELGKDGMGKISELSPNVVKNNKPKVLNGLNQKVPGLDRGLFLSSTQSCMAGGVETDPNPFVLDKRNVVSPMISTKVESRSQEGPIDQRVRTRKKRKPPCNGVDRAIPNPKGCRLPMGEKSREKRGTVELAGSNWTVTYDY